MMTEWFINSSDGTTNLYCCKYMPEGRPIAVLQIIHGMSEYIGRYKAFIEFLNDNGIMVVAEDHIGHGKSSKPEDFGYFGPKDGWKNWVTDVELLRQRTAAEHPELPYIMLGHSMGSFILRAYMEKYDCKALAGAIVMGTAGKNPLAGFGIGLVNVMRVFMGDRHRSKLVAAMAFGANNKLIDNPKGQYDWLTHDMDITDAYGLDPMCNFLFTLAGYADLFKILDHVSKDSWAGSVRKDLPILVASGFSDPVGNYGKGPAEVTEKLEAAGVYDVSMLLYDGMRHEILNENGKQAVWDDMRDFILDMAEEAALCDEDSAEADTDSVSTDEQSSCRCEDGHCHCHCEA